MNVHKLRPHNGYFGDPRQSHIDNVYFNASFFNESKTLAKPISFESSRNDNIVEAGSLYYLAVESFSIPSRSLPIFNFDNNEQSGGGLSAGLNNLRPFTVSRGTQAPVVITYKDVGSLVGGRRGEGGLVGPIYYVNQFLDMLNRKLGIGVGGVYNGRGLFPTFKFDSVTKLFSIEWSAISANDEDKLYLSAPLYNLFSGFSEGTFLGYRLENNKDYAIVPPTEGLTPDDRTIRAERPTLFAWNDIENILIFSNSLPVYEENFSNRLDNGVDEKYRVIATFDPYVRGDEGIDRSDYRFFTDYPRLIDLRSDININSVNFTVRILRKNGTLENVFLIPGDQARLKLRFTKRALFNNEYNIYKITERLEQNPIPNYHKKY